MTPVSKTPVQKRLVRLLMTLDSRTNHLRSSDTPRSTADYTEAVFQATLLKVQ